MDENISLENERIAVIEEYLSKENSGKLADSMSWDFKEELIKIFCPNEGVTHLDIVGYFEDNMKLASSIWSAIKEKPSKSGVLFLKDRFYYRKGTFSTPVQLSYDDVRYVDEKMASLVIYSDPSSPVTLSGISYSEPNQMPILFRELRNLNEDTIEVTRADKMMNFARKSARLAGEFIGYMVEEGQKQQAKNQQMLEKMSKDADRILSNPDAYSPEQVAKAQKFQRQMEKRTEEVQEILAHKELYSADEIQKARMFNNATGVYDDSDEVEQYEDDVENEYDEEYEVFETEVEDEDDDTVTEVKDSENSGQSEDKTEDNVVDDENDAIENNASTDGEERTPKEVANDKLTIEEPENTSEETVTYISSYQKLYDQYLKNPIYLENQHLKKVNNVFAHINAIWQYLCKNYDHVKEHFFTGGSHEVRERMPIINHIIKNSCYLPYPPTTMVGFSEKGINNFDAGFVLDDDQDTGDIGVIYLKESGKKISTIPFDQIKSITSTKYSVVVNDTIEISTGASLFSSNVVANVMNYYIVCCLLADGFLKELISNNIWTCKCGKRNENSFKFCPNCGGKKI